MITQHRYFYQLLKDQNSYDIDVAELLEELIYDESDNYLYLLSYYVNVLIRRQQVEEVFKILQEAITQSNNLLLQRRDSGYGSNLESCSSDSEETQYENYEEIEQYAADYTKLYEEIVKRITKTLINAGINIGTYKYERIETPLHWAARENNTNLINFFIELGVDIEIQNKRGATALHMAAVNNDPNTVRELIKQKSNKNLKALIEQGSSRELLKQRLKINVKDNEGNTALFLAVSCENYDVVKSLLNAGADPNVFCPLGDDLYIKIPELQNIKCTPLHLAAFIGNVELINLLINHGADTNAVCKNKKYSCLHMVVFGVTCYYDEGISEEKEEEYLEIVDSLISKFPNQIDVQDYEDSSPLHRAVSTKHEDTIRILLSHGIPLLQFRKGGYTPFHDAVSIENLTLVKLLLENSDKKVINSVYKGEGFSGYAPLHLAINGYIECFSQKNNQSDALEIIRYLLSYPDLDINIQDFQGETPLHYAVKYIKDDELTLINALLTAKDINPFIKDGSSKTPFDYAKEGNRNQILQALIDNKYGFGQDSLLHLAVAKGDVKIVKYLIGKKIFDINLENGDGYSPLHLALRNENIKVIEMLLDHGARIDWCEGCGYSPLQIAGIIGHLNAVKLLLKRGANINTRGINGAAVIHLVVNQYIQLLRGKNDSDLDQNNILKVIEYLLSCNELDINAQINQTQFRDDTANEKTVLHHLILNDVPPTQQNKKMNLIKKVLSHPKIDPFIKDAEDKTPIDYYIEQKEYNAPILNQYAKIQEERNAKVKSHKTKKCIACALTLCAINSVFAGICINQYILENITSDLSLIFITNVAILLCCLLVGKYVERLVEEKYKSKISNLFEKVESMPLSIQFKSFPF